MHSTAQGRQGPVDVGLLQDGGVKAAHGRPLHGCHQLVSQGRASLPDELLPASLQLGLQTASPACSLLCHTLHTRVRLQAVMPSYVDSHA